jgi:hypothetical protein
MLNEVHTPRRDMPIREIIKRARHDGCGGRPGRVEWLTGLAGASSRSVRESCIGSERLHGGCTVGHPNALDLHN